MLETEPEKARAASERIDERIEELGDWRGDTLARVRRLIQEVEPDVVEEWKWRGVPVWSRCGIVFTGETYRDKVKLTFPKGASLEDPSGFHSSNSQTSDQSSSARRFIVRDPFGRLVNVLEHE